VDEPPATGGDRPGRRPAFYAAGPGPWRDWWTLLHPPYTAWHLSYVVIGACLAPVVNATVLVGTVLAFFLAVGVAAHALDELHGRPLGTGIPASALVAAAACGLGGAAALGVAGVVQLGWPVAPFLVAGPVLVVLYDFELLGGIVHNDLGFAASWGAFPVLTAYVAQTGRLSWGAVAGAAGALALSAAQRSLSTPARALRRRTVAAEGRVQLRDGATVRLDRAALLAPLERALRAMAAAAVLLAGALALARLVG
jgi:hypothetical protein